MILAERLCLFGFDPHSGRRREVPERAASMAAMAAVMLADLLHAGRFTMTAQGLCEHDRLPMAHPMLDAAARRLSASIRRDPASVRRILLGIAPAAWRRVHRSLAERDILELQVPFPCVRRYRLRSRMAWHDAAAALRAIEPSERLRRITMTLAAQRCGWLADLVDANCASANLVEAQTAVGEDERVAAVAALLASC